MSIIEGLHKARHSTGCLVIVGGSGVGKSTLIERGLLNTSDSRFIFLTDTTTRERRATESGDAFDKNFVSQAEFFEMAFKHKFASWFRNEVNDEYYGTEWSVLFDAISQGRVLVTTIDGGNVKHAVKALKFFGPIVVWVRPTSIDTLEARLRGAGRGAAAATELHTRLAANRKGHELCQELADEGFFHHIIINDNLSAAITQMKEIGDSVVARWPRMLQCMRPFRCIALPTIAHSTMIAVWATKGGQHCDRPRLKAHMAKDAFHTLCKRRGLIDVIPAAGGRPHLGFWMLICFAPSVIQWLLSGLSECILRCSANACVGVSLSNIPKTWGFQSTFGALALAVVMGAVGSKLHWQLPVRFKIAEESILHFTLRWLGPFPVIVSLGIGTPGLVFQLLFIQGLNLFSHWILKGICEQYLPSIDPSGHTRVAVNTALYISWATTSTQSRLHVSFAAYAISAFWMLMQSVSVFQATMLHHTLVDVVLGFIFATPHLLYLWLLELTP